MPRGVTEDVRREFMQYKLQSTQAQAQGARP